MQASEAYKASLLKAKGSLEAGAESSGSVEAHTDGVTALMVAAVGGHMVSCADALGAGFRPHMAARMTLMSYT